MIRVLDKNFFAGYVEVFEPWPGLGEILSGELVSFLK